MIASGVEKIIEILTSLYGATPWNWHTQQTPFQILIGTVLSQRTRDEKTDAAAQALFSRYPSAAALAAAPVAAIERLIRPVNYYKTKAGRIKEISQILQTKYNGEPPESLAELTRLPGVGRKTASCVLVYGFGKAALPVDTHVHRISNRLGLIHTKTPEQSEKELWKLIPAKHLMVYNELMVKHGQNLCRPLSPQCPRCPLVGLCAHGSQRKRPSARGRE